jgi:hypothetical protein
VVDIPEQLKGDFDIRTVVRVVHENILPAIRRFVPFWDVLLLLVQLVGDSVQRPMRSRHNLIVYSSLFFPVLIFLTHPSEWSRPRHASLQNDDPRDVINDPRRIQTSVSPIRHSGVPRGSRRPQILFYHKHNPHYGFTNFSDHPVVYEGRTYPTSEHLYQSFKVCGEGSCI